MIGPDLVIATIVERLRIMSELLADLEEVGTVTSGSSPEHQPPQT